MSARRGDASPAAAPRPPAGSPARERAVEQLIGRLLQVGVALAAAVVILGGAVLLARAGTQPTSFAQFTGESPGLRSIARILGGAAALDPRAVVQLGLVLLIATPVARVALTLVAFAMQRDRLYVVITGIVLVLLTFALAGGAA